MNEKSTGKKFKEALGLEKPLQIVGVINAITALLAKEAGFKSLYLSGAGIANAQFGLPDLGLTTQTEVAEEIRRITARVELPLLVDGDTGWGTEFNIQRTVKEFIKAGAAGVHFEDQAWPKRCGHRPHKTIVSVDKMVNRIKAAVDARTDPDFFIMARTDALATEGLDAAIQRSIKYVQAGADMIFAEAMTEIEHYRIFVEAVKVPVLANMTEFGQTKLATVSELEKRGVSLVLYPLSAFRAMNKAAFNVFSTIRSQGTQFNVVKDMQTREELYQLLSYYSYEGKDEK